jgi:hypothetical protein
MRDSTRCVVKVERMESPFERGFREKETEYAPIAMVQERISGESVRRCDDGPGQLEVQNDLDMDLVQPLDGDNDQIMLSAFMANDSLDNDIALAMASAPQSITDANRKSRTGIDSNQSAGRAVQAADDSDAGRIRQVASFDRIHARIEKNGIDQQKKQAIGSDSVRMVEESPCLDKSDVQEESVSKEHDLLNYGDHVVDEEISSFDQSNVEPATDYQSQAECGSSTSDSDDQMREVPFRDSPTVEERKQRLMEFDKTCLGERIAELSSGTITDKDWNVTSLAGMPALHIPPPVNSKRKYNEVYESKHHEKWNRFFMELKDYKEKNGHCNIPTRNGSLGTWISYQRVLFRSKKLMTDRHEKLVGIGFTFEDARFASDHEKWNRCFMELVEYKEMNGHCNIPITTGSLGSWIAHQRLLFRSKKLKADRHEKLVEIGFTFVYESNIWNTQFMELVKYKEKNGNCNIPTNKGSLGNWIRHQRRLFRSNKLKKDRYDKLVEIGLTFEDVTALEFKGNLDQQWQNMYQKLFEDHKEMKGHCYIPRRIGSLGNWIELQRTLFRSKKLKADRYEKLVAIGFTFEAALEFKGKLDQQWHEMYQKLLEHKEMKGHCFNVPQTLPLGRWLSWQRWLYRNGKLREDRAEKLLSVGFNDKKGLKKGGAVSVCGASSGQPPRKNRKVEDLDNDSAAITHDEGEEGIDDINANGDLSDNGNAHKEVVEEHIFVATELVEVGIKEGHSLGEVAPPLEKNNEVHESCPAASV